MQEWNYLHYAVAAYFEQGQYDFKSIVENLKGYQKDFKINIKNNLLFIEAFAEVLHEDYRRDMLKGKANPSFPVRLITALQSLEDIDYSVPPVLKKEEVDKTEKRSIFTKWLGTLKRENNGT